MVMHALLDLAIFTLGLIAGLAYSLIALRIKPTPKIGIKPKTTMTTWPECYARARLAFTRVQSPTAFDEIQPKRPAVTAVPRSMAGWRTQKAELEREHNSRQKERDKRPIGL